MTYANPDAQVRQSMGRDVLQRKATRSTSHYPAIAIVDARLKDGISFDIYR